MDKNIIKKHLIEKFVNEAKGDNVPGLSITNSNKKESEKINKTAIKDISKDVNTYDNTLKKGMEVTDVNNKFNYNGNEEIDYHKEIETMNGQEMVQFDRKPNKEFSDRAKEAIEGSSRMGNNPEWANVIPAQQGFTGPEFGKNLVKNIEASFNKRMDAEKGIMSFGDDIELLPKGSKPMARFSALAENNDNNKPQIKEGMKRLKFKKEFNGVGNALKMIPESYKTDNKVFEMTDGVENYKIRWEGTLTEGRAIVLMASDKNLVNEDMQKMKHLMGYKSQETLGNVKGKARLDENVKFTDIWKKTKTLMEMEDIEGADAKEGNWDEINVPQAADAKKHVEGSVSTEKGTKAPKPKTGEFEKIKKNAPEATKHVTLKESEEEKEEEEKEDMPKAPSHEETDANQVTEEAEETKEVKTEGSDIEGTKPSKTAPWEDHNVKHAAEAKKHIMNMSEGVTLGENFFVPLSEEMDDYDVDVKKKDKEITEGMYEEGVYEEEATHSDNKLGINISRLLDEELAQASNIDFSDMKQRLAFINRIEDNLINYDWISTNHGVKFENKNKSNEMTEGTYEDDIDNEIENLIAIQSQAEEEGDYAAAEAIERKIERLRGY